MRLKSNRTYTEFIMDRKDFLKTYYLEEEIKLSDKDDVFSVVKNEHEGNPQFIFYTVKEKNPNPDDDSFVVYDKNTDEIRVGYNIMMCYLVILAKYMVEKDGFKLED